MAAEEFHKRLERYKAEEAQLKRRADLLANLRLLVFLAGATVSAILFYKSGILIGTLAAVLTLAAFVMLVNLHGKAASDRKKQGAMAEINRRALARMNDDWKAFDDSGQEFLESDHPSAQDLDLFGPHSLYQWLNTAATWFGRSFLRDLLAKPELDLNKIVQHQKAIRELAADVDFCQQLQCAGMLSAEGTAKDPADLLAYAEMGGVDKYGADRSVRSASKWKQNVYYILPGALILAFTLYFLGAAIPLFLPLLLLVMQMGMTALGFRKNSAVLDAVYGFRKGLGAYGDLLALIEKKEFSEGSLSVLKQTLQSSRSSSSEALKKLQRISGAIDVRSSTVLYFLLNFFFLWDYHCSIALEEWRAQNGNSIRAWLEAVGRMEALTSLAGIAALHPDWSYPVINDGGPFFAAEKVGHPLIREDVCVRNDFQITDDICVITGSNMSGKSTMLRTVGISLVLAYAGAPVNAASLRCSIMKLVSSMRVRDDLNSGISTFYAELLRVKMIVEQSKDEQPMLFLIDEIFKGTNSPDRILGARSVLKNLNKPWTAGLISTHDFELCELEKEDGVKAVNYHFTEGYENGQITFDYKIHPGRSTTTNARYLMQLVGIELSE